MRKIAITTGDPAGIGPEIAAKALRFLNLNDNIILIVYGNLLPFPDGNKVEKINSIEEAVYPKRLYWIEIHDDRVVPGQPSVQSGQIAYQILERCATDLNHNFLDAVVTCPISKEAIHYSHPEFIGHTEFFAHVSKTPEVIMSFWGPFFNLALLTTHVATKNVSDILTPDFVKKKLRLIYTEFNRYLPSPKFALLAINPHAGEHGAFGNEDERMKQVLQNLDQENIHIDGPFPADTFFAYHANEYKVVISAFHDQGLIPFKMISAEEGVNVTLGLPFVRTSVDHGTAFDIVGKNIASEKSLKAAIKMAARMLKCQNTEVNQTYLNFARYYDKYMAHVDYEDWVKFLLECFSKRFKRNPQKILELACGTANISSLMVKKGLQVDASDLSVEMLKIAARKPFKPYLYQQDMRTLLPTNKYDLVLLLFDSINYLTKSEEVLKLLRNVYITLKPDGLFIFDITTFKNCANNFDGFVNLEENSDSFLIHQAEFDEEELLQISKLTFFQKKGFLFERFDEIHKQKVYPVTELAALIEETDFQLAEIRSLDFQDNLLKSDLSTLDKNFSRLFFVLQKK